MNVLHWLWEAFILRDICRHLFVLMYVLTKLFHGSRLHYSLSCSFLKFPFYFVTATFHHSHVSCVANAVTFWWKEHCWFHFMEIYHTGFCILEKMTSQVIDEFWTTYWFRHSEATDSVNCTETTGMTGCRKNTTRTRAVLPSERATFYHTIVFVWAEIK